MMNTMQKTMERPRLSLKVQTLATLAAIAAAVALPQIFHVFGTLAGAGNAPAAAFLPMHLPIILAGLLAGPYVGLFAGILGPAVSFTLSGMPAAALLPFMMIELGVYGLTAGLLSNVRMPVIFKVLAVQAAGRAVRAAAVLAAVYMAGRTVTGVSSLFSSVAAGLPGIILQWILLPVIVYAVARLKKNEQ